MIQLFEKTSIDSNCDIGPNDEPFTMPILPQDHIYLRLQVPYYLVVANGGGLPVGANINVDFVDVTGATILCDLTTPASNKYLYNFFNNAGERIGGYNFMIPMSFVGYDYKTKAFSASTGNEIVADVNGTIYTWIYGVDNTPYPFIDYKSGGVCIRYPYLDPFTLYINGVGTVAGDLFTGDENSCLGTYCFRVRIKVTFGATTYEYYTKLFQFNYVCEDDTLLITSSYGRGMIDCAGQYYNGGNATVGGNELYLRINGDTERMPSKLTKTINQKCFLYRSEVQKMIRLRSLPMPQWFQDACETLMLGKNFKIDGVPYQLEQENIFENNDVQGSVFQNINVPLSTCKCENVFVC